MLKYQTFKTWQKIDRNKNIVLQNHIKIMPLYNSFKSQPFGTSESSNLNKK